MPMKASSTGRVCACLCADLCTLMSVCERVRLIEVVRVKMIPSGGRSRWKRCVWVQEWVTGLGEKTGENEAYIEG